jgi:acyl-coenzyme A thioesterase PaaI-like protein
MDKPGKITTRLKYKDILMGNRYLKMLHGGVPAGFLERSGALCAENLLTSEATASTETPTDKVKNSGPPRRSYSADPNKLPTVTTIDLDINFLKPAPMGSDLLCDAIVSSRTSRLVRVDFRCYDETRTKKIVSGAGLYLIQ